MKSAQILLYILCFFLDVHVKAAAAECSAGGCVLNAKSARLELKSPAVVMDKGSLAEFRQNQTLHLVRGIFYVHGEGVFNTPFAKFSCEGECRALIERHPGHAVVQNLGGDWRVERLGDAQPYMVPAAMQVTVREVSSDGHAEMDFPQSLPWLATAKTWGRLFPGEAKEFKHELAAFREQWNEAVEAASDLHQRTASREVASAKKAADAALAARLAREKEDRELREAYRRKNHISP